MSTHRSPLTTHGFFVTGTDTGVGKTLVACSLLRAFANRGFKVAGMKPVASGAVPREHVNPYCFEPPVAPHIAAAGAGMRIDLDRIGRSYGALAARADVVVVEGIGGFRVPLGPGIDTAQLAARLALPLVLVVGLRLGCLNHALLTVEAIADRGLKLAGWVANHADPGMAAAEENVRALETLIGAPLLARIAFTASPDIAAGAALFDTRLLD